MGDNQLCRHENLSAIVILCLLSHKATNSLLECWFALDFDVSNAKKSLQVWAHFEKQTAVLPMTSFSCRGNPTICRTYMHWIFHKHLSLDLDMSVWEQFPCCCMFADYGHLATHVPVSSAGFGCQCHHMKKHRICVCSIMVLWNSNFCCSVLQVNKLVGETYQQTTFLHGQTH